MSIEKVKAYFDVSGLAEGMYAFDAMEIDAMFPEDHGPVAARILAFSPLDGVYTINAVDTPMARQVFDSLVILNTAR